MNNIPTLTTKVCKMGNSVIVTIPKEIVENCNIEIHEYIEWAVGDNCKSLQIKRTGKKKKITKTEEDDKNDRTE